jgi:hypothetical protein
MLVATTPILVATNRQHACNMPIVICAENPEEEQVMLKI